VEDCFTIHKAKWYKSSHSKFGNDKLKRALKRHNGDSAALQPSCKFTKFSLQTKHIIGTEVCFFCNESEHTRTMHASLFSKLYISCQTRQSNMSTFFAHENQPFLSALSHISKLRTGSKPDIIDCLCKLML
jgi:hypothetical protein